MPRQLLRAALKEWQSVVTSLESGQTNLILRKGGILEGRSGFNLEHDRFFLLPTQWHEQEQAGTLDPTTFAMPRPIVRSWAEVLKVISFAPGADLSVLDGQHAYSPRQIAKRRDFRPKLPLYAILVCVHPLSEPIDLSGAAIEGCKSWVELGEQAVEVPYPDGSARLASPGLNPHSAIRNSPGFTLVELLVVIGIIAVLLALLLPSLNSARSAVAAVKSMSDLRQLTHAYTAYTQRNKGALLPGYLPAGAPEVYEPVTKKTIAGLSARRWTPRLAQFSPEVWKLARPGRTDIHALVAAGTRHDFLSAYPVFGLNAVYLGGYDTPAKVPFGGLHLDGSPIRGRHVIFRLSEVRRPAQQIVFVEVRAENALLAVDVDETHLGFHYVTPPRAAGVQWNRDAKDGIQLVDLTRTAGLPFSRAGGAVPTSFLDGHVERLTPRDLSDMRKWTPRADTPEWDLLD